MKTNMRVRIPVNYNVAAWARAISRSSDAVGVYVAWSWTKWVLTDLEGQGMMR